MDINPSIGKSAHKSALILQTPVWPLFNIEIGGEGKCLMSVCLQGVFVLTNTGSAGVIDRVDYESGLGADDINQRVV